MPGTRKGRRRGWEKEGGIPFLPPAPRRAPLPFYLDTSTQTDILVVQAFDSAIHLKNLCPVDTYYRNQLRHPLNRGLSSE